MGIVNPTALVDWQDGQTVSSIDYKRERDLVVTANNDTHDRILTHTNWLAPVANFAEIGTTYLTPVLGDTVQALDTGYVYRYNNTEWTYTQGYSATAIADVNTQLAETMIYVNLSKYKSYVIGLGTADEDWSPAIVQAHTEWVSGDVLVIDRPTKIKSPVVWSKKGDILCIGDKGYFISDVGITNDAITINGMTVNYASIRINLYGLANSCKNGLVVDAVNLSKIHARIKTGAVGYGFVAKGSILNEYDIHISSNYSAPLVGAVMPAHHILLDTGINLISETNASVFYLMLEGGNGDGITKTNTSPLETVEFKGTIEGIGGKPFNLNTAWYININNLHLELNVLESTFTNCKNIEVGSGVRNNLGKFTFINSQGISIDGYSGSLEFDTDCTGTVKQIGLEGLDTIVNNSKGVFLEGAVVNFSDKSRQGVVGIGKNVPENLFHNPFVDIWSGGANVAPDGFSGATTTFSKELINYYLENPSKMSVYCQQTGATIGDGTKAKLKTSHNMNSERWVSVTIPIYVPTGQPNVRVFIFDVDQFRTVHTVTKKDEWVLVCGSSKVNANKDIYTQVSPHDGVGYVAGNYYIGGLTVINGNVASKYLIDHGKRNEYIVTSVTNIPSFVGQRALVAGVWYMAKGTTASTDWVAI